MNPLDEIDGPLLGYDPIPDGYGAIYCLIDGDKILYIGQTKDIGTRARAHLKKDQFAGCTILYKIVPLDQLSGIERAMILKYDPPYNWRFSRDHRSSFARGPIKEPKAPPERRDGTRVAIVGNCHVSFDPYDKIWRVRYRNMYSKTMQELPVHTYHWDWETVKKRAREIDMTMADFMDKDDLIAAYG